NTLVALLRQNVIPIINENDTVATEEIRVGDNDNLSALAANLIDADVLILLTDQDGLFTADPRSNPNAELVQTISGDSIPEAVWQAAGGAKSGLGTGGMLTKIQAADLARRSGTACIIANGKTPDVLLRLVVGEQIGTRFEPVVSAVEARKRYILSARRAPGLLSVDSGAAQALRRGSSLLAVGVSAVSGTFKRSDVIRVADAEGHELARGISNYDSRDLARILRKRSDEIEAVLGYHYGDEVIHRNDLVLL
ncbi:MAG TPA: glutamate 5-kinase, partial [Anaerolineae bacterium]|nr:glutamate 5-kinase [Anaerolineae bacterium]